MLELHVSCVAHGGSVEHVKPARTSELIVDAYGLAEARWAKT
ncbi:MAG: hypothetical protein ABR604_02940 [Jatrophihabitantaceae bacterium]